MGAELSKPVTEEEKAEFRAAKGWTKDGEQKVAAYKARRVEESKQTEVASAAAAIVKEPELIRSSEGDAGASHTFRQPPIVGNDSAQASQSEESDDPLSEWKPRKERVVKGKSAITASSTTSDVSFSQAAFLGFGHEVSTQEAQPSSERQPAPTHKHEIMKQSSKAPTAITGGASPTQQSTPPLTLNTRALEKQPLSTSSRPTPNTPSSANTPATASAIIYKAVPAKRGTTSAFADERRESLPKVGKRAAAASPRSPIGSAALASLPQIPKKTSAARSSDKHDAAISIDTKPPQWYQGLKRSNTRTRNADEASTALLMENLKTDIRKCASLDRRDQVKAGQLFNTIRDKLHKLPFKLVSAQLLYDNRMLHDRDGLPQLFDASQSGGVTYPFDIKADAEELYNKWCRRIFETDLYRGIIRGKPATKKEESSSDRLEESYAGRLSAKFSGNGSLLNGQWWPTQLATVRDGAHGATIAGICGAEGQGAFSCIMSGGHDYEDEDHGSWVLYCGTDSTDGSVTEKTKMLLQNENNKQPVRLIRSHNLGSEWAPVIGFRYDGLYKIVSHEMLDTATSLRQRHRFRLERLSDQDPIRGGDGPERRPTAQEVEACKTDKKLRGYT